MVTSATQTLAQGELLKLDGSCSLGCAGAKMWGDSKVPPPGVEAMGEAGEAVHMLERGEGWIQHWLRARAREETGC